MLRKIQAIVHVHYMYAAYMLAVIARVVAPGARLRRRMRCSALPRLVAYTLAEAAVAVVVDEDEVSVVVAVVVVVDARVCILWFQW